MRKNKRKSLMKLNRLQQIGERKNRIKKEQEEYQKLIKELKAEEELRDKLWAEYQQEKENMKLKEQERDIWLQVNEGNVRFRRKLNNKRREEELEEERIQALGKGEGTMPPKYRGLKKEKQPTRPPLKETFEGKSSGRT